MRPISILTGSIGRHISLQQSALRASSLYDRASTPAGHPHAPPLPPICFSLKREETR